MSDRDHSRDRNESERFLPASPDAQRWARHAVGLVSLTAVYNSVEAVVAIGAGVAAGSLALVAFGLDSVIELVAAGLVLRRLLQELRGSDLVRLAQTERRVHRLVGWSLLALAAYVVVDAGWSLWRRDRPEESLIGIALALVSVVIMPVVAWAKLRAARALQSGALRAEALETLACAWLSLALLVGLAANAALGWWWADPVAALAMTPWLVREGKEALG